MPEDTFFDSDVVTEAIRDIVELQDKVMAFAQYGEFATIKEQQENLKTLRELMTKQKNMCFRCTLTDSPDAKKLLHEVLNHFVQYGHTVDFDNPLEVFGEVQDNLDDIEFELDFFQKYGRYPDDEEEGGETPPTMF
jgi:hypothetical protein